VGCGTGTFLSVLAKLGTQRVLGVDGGWVDRTLLDIDASDFLEHNLESALDIEEKFDLAICLEVAEHLSDDIADSLIASLTRMSDLVLFSAAIPGQGGNGHINEQWQSYWAKKFEKQGFAPFDCIRPSLWQCTDVLYWYRQNTIVYRRSNSRGTGNRSEHYILDIVHPEAFARSRRKSTLERLVSFVKSVALRAFSWSGPDYRAN
jgi:SAM-dependent methyltransferase